MDKNGYIKLYRSMLDWEWFTDINTLAVFVYLLLKANWEDTRYRGHLIPKGSLVTGRKVIAETLNLSEREVRTALDHLKSTNEVTIKTTNKFSVVTITNWEKFQCLENEATNKMTNKATNNRPTIDQQSTTYKEIKNIRSKENNNNIGDKKFIPPSIDEVRAYCQERNNNVDPEAFISFYESKGWMIGKNKMKDWRACVRTWERNRKEEKKSQTDIYRNYRHGNYDFDALEKELREKPKRQHYDFEAIDKEIREK